MENLDKNVSWFLYMADESKMCIPNKHEMIHRDITSLQYQENLSEVHNMIHLNYQNFPPQQVSTSPAAVWIGFYNIWNGSENLKQVAYCCIVESKL